MVSNSREILLKLVRIAMGWESDLSLPLSVNWADVLRIAYEQGVASIAFDGYQKYIDNNPSVQSFLSIRSNDNLKGQILGDLLTTESNYFNHLTAISKLSDVLAIHHIPFMVMKGFSCAQYYPIPKHRSCGDIDIYPGEMFSESNEALKTAGIEVSSKYYRHSTSKINGVMVENHRILCDLRGPRRQTRALEWQLEYLAKESLEKGGDAVIDGHIIPGAIFPSANFNALFLPWHVSAHFEFERVVIRHLLDWALFLTHEGKNIDVELYRDAKRKYSFGLSKIADILTYLAIHYLHIPTGAIPVSIIEDAMNIDCRLADRVFDYMFEGQSRKRDSNVWAFRLNNARRIWQERWKYKQIYGMSAIGFLIHKFFGVILRVGE